MVVLRRKSTSTKVDKLAPFTFHGMQFREKKGQAVGDCPLCGKEGHFFVSLKTGQWDCKVCGKKGNSYTFLSLLHKQSEKTLKEVKEPLQTLSKNRKLPSVAFRDHRLGSDGNGRIYLPVFSPENANSLVGLRVYDGPDTKVLSTSGTSLHLLRGHLLHKDQKEKRVYLCEGDWDTIALEYLRTKVAKDGLVVGVPGASIFKQEWLPLFKGKEVYLCFDNDNAGQDGQAHVADKLIGIASSVKTLLWPAVAEGYDLNDFVSERLQTPKAAWRELHGMFIDHKRGNARDDPEKPKRKIKIPSFQAVLKEFGKQIHLDDDMRDCIAITLAAGLSIQIPGDPVWLFIIGPPGAGKTLVLKSMSASPLCHFESNLKPHALVSGMRLDDGSDASLIPLLKDRVLILKDYTEIRSQSVQTQEEIYGVLRGAFDGHVKVSFGNGLVREYDPCRFAMIAGVTHEIHGDNRASLGERFLKCEFLGKEHDPSAHIRAAITGMDKRAKGEHKLHELVGDFLSQEVNLKKLPKVPDWVVDRLTALVQIVAYLRASVVYSKAGDLNYRPQAEIGTRLGIQLFKEAQSLAVLFQKRIVDKACYRLIEKIAFDTATGFHLDLIRVLMHHYPQPRTREDIALEAKLATSTANRKLQSLLELKAVTKDRVSKAGAGQPAYGYRVEKKIANLWKVARIGE